MADEGEHPWGSKICGWLAKKGKTDIWKGKYFWLEDGLLTVYGEDPASTPTAKPTDSVELLNGACRVVLGNDESAPVFSLPAGVAAEQVVIVLGRNVQHIFHADEAGEASTWFQALRSATRATNPQKEALRTLPSGLGEGWTVMVPSARDTGEELLYRVEVVVGSRDAGVSRVTCRVTYNDLADLNSDLEASHPVDMAGISFPTARIFRSRDPAAMPQRLEAIEKYLTKLAGKQRVWTSPATVKRFHLKEAVAKAKSSSIPHVVSDPPRGTSSPAAPAPVAAAGASSAAAAGVRTALPAPARSASPTKRTPSLPKGPNATSKSPTPRGPTLRQSSMDVDTAWSKSPNEPVRQFVEAPSRRDGKPATPLAAGTVVPTRTVSRTLSSSSFGQSQSLGPAVTLVSGTNTPGGDTRSTSPSSPGSRFGSSANISSAPTVPSSKFSTAAALAAAAASPSPTLASVVANGSPVLPTGSKGGNANGSVSTSRGGITVRASGEDVVITGDESSAAVSSDAAAVAKKMVENGHAEEKKQHPAVHSSKDNGEGEVSVSAPAPSPAPAGVAPKATNPFSAVKKMAQRFDPSDAVSADAPSHAEETPTSVSTTKASNLTTSSPLPTDIKSDASTASASTSSTTVNTAPSTSSPSSTAAAVAAAIPAAGQPMRPPAPLASGSPGPSRPPRLAAPVTATLPVSSADSSNKEEIKSSSDSAAPAPAALPAPSPKKVPPPVPVKRRTSASEAPIAPDPQDSSNSGDTGKGDDAGTKEAASNSAPVAVEAEPLYEAVDAVAPPPVVPSLFSSAPPLPSPRVSATTTAAAAVPNPSTSKRADDEDDGELPPPPPPRNPFSAALPNANINPTYVNISNTNTTATLAASVTSHATSTAPVRTVSESEDYEEPHVLEVKSKSNAKMSSLTQASAREAETPLSSLPKGSAAAAAAAVASAEDNIYESMDSADMPPAKVSPVAPVAPAGKSPVSLVPTSNPFPASTNAAAGVAAGKDSDEQQKLQSVLFMDVYDVNQGVSNAKDKKVEGEGEGEDLDLYEVVDLPDESTAVSAAVKKGAEASGPVPGLVLQGGAALKEESADGVTPTEKAAKHGNQSATVSAVPAAKEAAASAVVAAGKEAKDNAPVANAGGAPANNEIGSFTGKKKGDGDDEQPEARVSASTSEFGFSEHNTSLTNLLPDNGVDTRPAAAAVAPAAPAPAPAVATFLSNTANTTAPSAAAAPETKEAKTTFNPFAAALPKPANPFASAAGPAASATAPASVAPVPATTTANVAVPVLDSSTATSAAAVASKTDNTTVPAAPISAPLPVAADLASSSGVENLPSTPPPAAGIPQPAPSPSSSSNLLRSASAASVNPVFVAPPPPSTPPPPLAAGAAPAPIIGSSLLSVSRSNSVSASREHLPAISSDPAAAAIPAALNAGSGASASGGRNSPSTASSASLNINPSNPATSTVTNPFQAAVQPSPLASAVSAALPNTASSSTIATTTTISTTTNPSAAATDPTPTAPAAVAVVPALHEANRDSPSLSHLDFSDASNPPSNAATPETSRRAVGDKKQSKDDIIARLKAKRNMDKSGGSSPRVETPPDQKSQGDEDAPELETVKLMKEQGTPLGISITGGKGTDRGDFAIYINRIIENSVAERDGRLHKGDQVVSVNGVSMENATLQQAVETLRSAPTEVVLVVAKGALDKLRRKVGRKQSVDSGAALGMDLEVSGAAAGSGTGSGSGSGSGVGGAAGGAKDNGDTGNASILDSMPMIAAAPASAAIETTKEANANANATAVLAKAQGEGNNATDSKNDPAPSSASAAGAATAPTASDASTAESNANDKNEEEEPAPAISAAHMASLEAATPVTPAAVSRNAAAETPLSSTSSSVKSSKNRFSLFGRRASSDALSPEGGAGGAAAADSARGASGADVSPSIVRVKSDKSLATELRTTFLRLLKSTTHSGAQSAVFHVKHETEADGADVSKGGRSWKVCTVTLQGCILLFGSGMGEGIATLGGPHFLTSEPVVHESHKKRGGVLRVKTRSGEFLFQPEDAQQLRTWKSLLDAPAVTILDCCHYISTDAKDALDRYFARVSDKKTTNALRLPVVVLGLRGAGKTSLIETLLHHDSRGPVQPTEGCNTVQVPWSSSLVFQVKDIAGDPDVWPQHITAGPQGGPYAVIYVVDSKNVDDLNQSCDLLNELIGSLDLRNSIFVVVANKQGYMEIGSIEAEQLSLRLGMDHRYKRNIAFITANAHQKTGPLEVFSYIAATVPGAVSTG